MDSQGVPSILLPLIILLELGGGLLVLVGYKARIAAFLLGGFSVISGILFHYMPSLGMDGFDQQLQQIMFI